MPDLFVPNTLVDESGASIPADQIPAAIASGKVRVREGEQLTMRGPDGKEQLVPPEQIAQALQQGWQVKSAETAQREAHEAEFGGTGWGATVAAGKALESVPFVGAPATRALLGEEGYRKYGEAVKEHPIAAFGGEAAGIVGQVVATGGLGAARTAAARGVAGATEAAGAARTAEAFATGAPTLKAAAEVVTAPWRLTVEAPGRMVAAGARTLLEGAGAGERTVAVGGRIAQMATEGASLGASAQLAEDELHATPLRAERIAHAAGMGALFGAGAELGLAAVGGAVRAGGKLIVKEGESVSDALRRWSYQERFNSIRATGVETRKLAPGRELELGQRLEEARLASGKKVVGPFTETREMVEPVRQAQREAGERVGALKKEVIEAEATNPATLRPDSNKLLKDIDAIIDEGTAGIQTADSIAKTQALRNQVAPLRARVEQSMAGEVVPHIATEAERVAAKATLRQLGKFGEVWQKEAADLGKTLADDGFDAFAGKLAKAVKTEGGTMPAGLDLVQLEKTIKQNPQKFGELMGKDFDGFVATVGDELGGAAPLSKFDTLQGPPVSFAELDAYRQKLSDIVYEQRRVSMGLPVPVSMGKEDLRRIERTVADELAASGERALVATGKDPTAWRAANREYHDWKEISGLVEKRAKELESHRRFGVTEIGAGIAGAAAMGPAGALASLGAKFFKERGGSMATTVAGAMSDAIRHAETRAGVATKVLGLGRSAREAAPLLAAATLGTKKERPKFSDDDVQEIAKAAQALVALPPDQQQTAVLQSLGDFALTNPKQTALAVPVMIAQAKYLADAMPQPKKDPAAKLMPAAQQPPLLDRIAAYEFKQKLEAIADPTTVIEDLKDGIVNPVAIQAVQINAPETWQDWRYQILRSLKERTRPPDVHEAYLLGSVFGLPLSPELDPVQGRAAQEAHKLPEPAQSEAPSQDINIPSMGTRSDQIAGV